MFQLCAMFRVFYIGILIVGLVVLMVPPGAHAGQHPVVRVAVVKNVPDVKVRAARSLVTISGTDGAAIMRTKEVTLRAQSGMLRVSGNPVADEYVTITAKPALYYIGRNKYRGELRVYAHKDNALLVVNELDIEDYLAGLINSEISSNWPIEAVKAQAVAARTYALNQIGGTNRYSPNARYDVEATVADQVYHGAHREDERAYQGVRATTGMVLTRSGVIFPSFYHSTCGGLTEHARNAWADMQGPPSVVDKYCERSPHRAWFFALPRSEFIGLMTGVGIMGKREIMTSVGQVPFADSPRVDEVVIITDKGERRIKATELRRMIGYTRLKSTWFNVGIEGDQVVFAGRGFGHGVGLCQWGAKGMAGAGHTWRDILKHYYGDAEVGRMY